LEIPSRECFLAHAVGGWFLNGGGECWVVRVGGAGSTISAPDLSDGLLSLEEVESVTILASPDLVGGHTDLRGQVDAQTAMIAHCEHMGDRLAILDLPQLSVPDAIEFVKRVGRWDSMHAVLYYPWVTVMDPTSGLLTSVPPSGHVAGCWARNDRERGVWNAPANLALAGAIDVSEALTQSETSYYLQPEGINVIRSTDLGIRVWGSRTTTRSSRYSDIGAARLICALERFIIKATSWAAFQPSNVRTWHRLETNVRIILESLWKKGAFAGGSAEEAFYVACDENVNPLEVTEASKIRIEFAFRHASLADFVHILVEQPTGSSSLFAE
jgi:phage tail sheath protein FI